MAAVPGVPPLTIPEAMPMVATAGLALDQDPPEVALLSVTDCPGHTLAGPVIAAGRPATVTVFVAKQPAGGV